MIEVLPTWADAELLAPPPFVVDFPLSFLDSSWKTDNKQKKVVFNG